MSGETFPEAIDLVIYINLNVRTDRREAMEKELARVRVPEGKILRWEATRNTKAPVLGCTMSHIAALEYIASLPPTVQNILILEDDFSFIDDVSLVNASLKAFLEYPRENWDFALLYYTVLQKADYNDLVSIAIMVLGAAGYLVNRSAVPLLIENLKESAAKFAKSGSVMLHAHDVYWHHIMKREKTFYFNKTLGYQRRSYSNITGKIGIAESKFELLSPRTAKRRHHDY